MWRVSRGEAGRGVKPDSGDRNNTNSYFVMPRLDYSALGIVYTPTILWTNCLTTLLLR